MAPYMMSEQQVQELDQDAAVLRYLRGDYSSPIENPVPEHKRLRARMINGNLRNRLREQRAKRMG